jgi:glyoxylase-like metal-dependent hydrolase (beta-lactamase superfamily II)
VLSDGVSVLGRERFLRAFPDTTETDYRQAYADIRLAFDAAHISFNVFVAKIGNELVLVDTGEGDRPTGGFLLESMRLAGIAPETITRVVITHSHGDHVLGILADAMQPVFPNATYVISKAEMAFWQAHIEDAAPEQRPIVAMMETQGLRLIDMDEEIIPGMTAIPLAGHTPGQIGLLFESENEKLIHLADLLHVPIQFVHPEWWAKFDTNTSLSVPTRRDTLQWAAAENLLTLFYHLTFPGLGHVKQGETGFIWKPLEES